jgi:regulatory protein
MLGDEAESPPDGEAHRQEYGESDYGRGLSAAERELCAALVLARKRRLGPFASPAQEGPDTEEAVESESAEDWAAGEWDEDAPAKRPVARRTTRGGRRADAGSVHRALGVLARAGFARDTAARALEMTREEADEWLERLKAES